MLRMVTLIAIRIAALWSALFWVGLGAVCLFFVGVEVWKMPVLYPELDAIAVGLFVGAMYWLAEPLLKKLGL